MSDYLDARDVARELLLTDRQGRPSVDRLRRMAERREYPELLHVTRGEYRVRRADHEAWVQGRMTMAEQARAELQWYRVREKLTGAR